MILAGWANDRRGGGHQLGRGPASEQESWRASERREAERYQLDSEPTQALVPGDATGRKAGRRWWDLLIVAVAVGVFFFLAQERIVPR